MIEAAQVRMGDPGWGIQVTTAGLQVTYTWQYIAFHPFTNRPMPGNFYTFEAFVPWTTLAHAPKNPLLAVMDDLLKQKTEFKP